MNKNRKWLLIALISSLLGAATAQPVKEYMFPTNGGIITVGVTMTWLNGTAVSTINWGLVENNTAYIMEPINVTNIENTPVTLSLSTQDWSTSIVSLILTWNYTGAVLAPGDSVIVELEQTITASGEWSYTTVVAAQEAV